MANKDRYLTIAQAAEFLNVSKTSLRRWTNKGALQCYRIGSRNERRFLIDDLMAFMPASTTRENLPQQSRQTVSQRELPGHLCTQYSSLEEQWALLKPHFLSHLDEGTRIVYLYDDNKSHIHAWLSEEGLDTALLQAAGTLRLIPAAQSYLKDGHFDTQRMLDFWDQVITAARRDGVKRLLLTGEMAWSTRGALGSGELIRYEAALDEILRPNPWITVVCQYDLSAFSAEVVFQSLCTHPSVQLRHGMVAGLG